MKIAAIPTLYAGIQFRSRLEARWFVFFEILAFLPQYEPFDLDGWIPDFKVSWDKGADYLVEVKPLLDEDDPGVVAVKEKIDAAAPSANCLIVGVRPLGFWEIGWVRNGRGGTWGILLWEYLDRKKDQVSPEQAERAWLEAGNRVQYKRPR